MTPGGASAPVQPPERASFGPKAPAIAMAGRPLIKDQPKAKSPGHGAPWRRDRGSARHRDAPSFAAARPHENLTAGAPFTLNANLQAQLAPLAAGFRERVANNTAKKQRAGRHPRRGAPALCCARTIPRRSALPALRARPRPLCRRELGSLLLFNHHGPYPRFQGHSPSRTLRGVFRCRSSLGIRPVLPDRDLAAIS